MNNIHLLSDEHRHYYYYGYDHLSQPMTEQPHHFQPTLNTTIPSPIEPNINQFQTGEEREVKPSKREKKMSKKKVCNRLVRNIFICFLTFTQHEMDSRRGRTLVGCHCNKFTFV